jgi:predicted nucleic acid-binding protein
MDSNTLIVGVLKRKGFEPVQGLLNLAQAGRIELYISALTYVEVRGAGRNDPYDADVDQAILAALDSPSFMIVEFYRGLAIRARQYTQTLRLKNYDAIHLASATEAQADVFMTWDTDFARGTAVDGVWIDEPYEPGDPPLFTMP